MAARAKDFHAMKSGFPDLRNQVAREFARDKNVG
jgi:hypothetical protein